MAQAAAMAAAAPTSSLRVAEGRTVVSYEPDGFPLALVVGYEHDGGFFLEDVVSTGSAGALRRLLVLSIAEAWRRGHRYVALEVHAAHPYSQQLAGLARRFGFTTYCTEDGVSRLVLYRRS